MLTPTPPPPADTPRPATGNLPNAELDVSNLASAAATEWAKRPALTLLWITSADFAELAKKFAKSLGQTDSSAESLAPGTDRLQQLDPLINEKTKYVKKMLALKYDEQNDGRAYYKEFGLVFRGGSYRFDNRRAERAEGLGKLVAALPKHGLADEKYGVAFWQPIATEYAQLVQETTDTRGDLSTDVATKSTLREQVEDVLLALINLIKANYPKTWRAELRAFGFQKENY